MRLYFFLLIALVGALVSCNEEITVGSTILEDTTIDVEFTDTLDLEVKTVVDDTVIVFRSNVSNLSGSYLLGEINDPSFGFSKSDIYMSTSLNVISPGFDTLTVDSVVMIIPLDTLSQAGNTNAIHDIKVFQLEEELKTNDNNNILASDAFAFGSTSLGGYNGVVNHRDSVNVQDALDRDSLILEPAQLRVTMDLGYWETILRDTTIMNDADVFEETLKGFVLRSETSESSMAGLNLSNSSAKRILVYFSSLDNTRHNVYRIDIGETRSSQFTHDYTGTNIETLIDQPATDFAYLQTMQGVNIEVDLKSVLALENTIINRATLELFLLDEADPVIDPIESLDVVFVNENGSQIQILDGNLADSPSSTIDYLGGQLESEVIGGQTFKKYQLDITNQVVLIARGEFENSKIVIEGRNKPQRASQSIILGPDHPDFPLKLKLVTSKP